MKSYVVAKHIPDAKKVEKLLSEIVSRRFKGAVRLARLSSEGGFGEWNLVPGSRVRVKDPSLFSFRLSLFDSRRFVLECPEESWAIWASKVVLNGLATAYKGFVVEEGFPLEKTRGDSSWCPTYRSYFNLRYAHQMAQEMAFMGDRTPKVLKSL